MKLRIKIAVIAMLGITFGANAQDYVPKTGGTFTGSLVVKGNLTAGDGNWGALFINGKDKNDWLLNAHNNGKHLYFRSQDDTQASNSSILMTLDRLSGNVGIGGISPLEAKLVVKSSTQPTLSGNKSGGIAIIGRNTELAMGASSEINGGSWIQTRHVSSTYPNAAYPLALNPLGGNVGIGTDTPLSKLHVFASGTGDKGITIQNDVEQSGNSASIWFKSASSRSDYRKGALMFVNDGRTHGRGDFVVALNDSPSSTKATSSDAKMIIKSETGNVGIATTSPNFKLDINAGGSLQNAFNVGTTHDDGGKIYTSYENGSGYLNFVEYDDPFVLNFIQTVDGGITEKIYYHRGKFGIGTRTTGGHKLAVEGSIGAREIKVEAAPNWSDFVFYEDYDLPTLTEVENHIKEKGHLKDIPSAEEVAKDGFYLGAMDAKLLQKIEELTLYTIGQQKEIEQLKKENIEIKQLNQKLLEVYKRLEKLENQ